MTDKEMIYTGNAKTDGAETRGWFVGGFLPEACGLRSTNDVEVKWSEHEPGAARTEWVTSETRTTVAVLISGEFTMEFRDQTITLTRPGDYVMWSRGTDHKWRVPNGGTLLTMRWPSESN